MSRRQRPTGVVLALVLICLTVTMLILGVMLKRVAWSYRFTRLRHHQLQAQWLADSAMERALAQLQQDFDYRGETWRLTAADMGGRFEAQAMITVEGGSGDADRPVHVVVEYPLQQPLLCRVETKRIWRSPINKALK
jgi:type II secretory pathway component PulK